MAASYFSSPWTSVATSAFKSGVMASSTAGDGAATGMFAEEAEGCAGELALSGVGEGTVVAWAGTSLLCDLSLRAISPKDGPSCAKEVEIEKAKNAIQSKYLRTMATA